MTWSSTATLAPAQQPPHSSPETPIDAWIAAFPMSIANSAADWLYGEFLLKYDNLKISLTEGGVGWVPYFLERAEFTLDHHGPGPSPTSAANDPQNCLESIFSPALLKTRAACAIAISWGSKTYSSSVIIRTQTAPGL